MDVARDPTAARTEPVAGTFFARLDGEQRGALGELGVRRSFPRETILMFEGEPEERLILLLAGRVKVTHASSDGREILLSIRDPGDLLGELAFIDSRPRIATVAAVEGVDSLVMAAGTFRSYLETTPTVAAVLLEVVAERFREATADGLRFSELDTLGRIAARLGELADRYGEGRDGVTVVKLPISQEELASWAGASRAGAAQALHALRELGWIETDRGRVTIKDADALRARASN